MFGLSASVRLLDLGPRDGLLRGEVGGLRWEARLTRGPVTYGLNPETLYKGTGCIARLVLYEPVTGLKLGRKVAAFDRGWQFGRKEHLSQINRVVRYLERQ